jgi:acyl carrier protein
MKSLLLDKNAFLKFTANELMVALDAINFETEFRLISSWSSLNALIYISRINEESDVFISSSDLAKLKTIGEIHDLIQSRINGVI